MEELIVTQGQGFRKRPGAVKDALSAYQTAAWRAPGQTRFDSRPANDVRSRVEVVLPTVHSINPSEEMPRWVIIAVGAVVAAIMGALLGGMLSL